MESLVFLYVFSSLVLIAAGIALQIFVAKEFEKIAEMKGHAGKRYFWWTFFLGLVGMLMVASLPDRRKGNWDLLPDELPRL